MKTRYAIIPAVYLLLQNDSSETLFLRRYQTGYQDGHFSLVAGHIEEGETPQTAAAREAQEEVGLTIQPADVTVVHTSYRPNVGRVDFFVRVAHWQGTPTIMETNKCNELKWSKTMPTEIIPSIRPILNGIVNGEPFSINQE